MLTATLEQLSLQAQGSGAGIYRARYSIKVRENDPNLADQLVTATIYWGDGSQLALQGRALDYYGSFDNDLVYREKIETEASHDFLAGIYGIRVVAHNYRDPIQDQVVATELLRLEGAVSVTDQGASIVGPILPSDVGYPSIDQWNLNIDKDLKLLASSVKMILITDVGERSMLATFGSNLKRYLFEPSDGNTKALIEAEVRRAINRWEPRVAVAGVQTSFKDKTMVVDLDLISLLDRQKFQLNVRVTQ